MIDVLSSLAVSSFAVICVDVDGVFDRGVFAAVDAEESSSSLSSAPKDSAPRGLIAFRFFLAGGCCVLEDDLVVIEPLTLRLVCQL